MFNEYPIIRKIRDTYTLHTVIRCTVDVLISCLWVRSLSSFSNCARCSMIVACPPEDLPVHLLVHHCFMPSSCLFHKNNECHYLWAPMHWRLGDKDTRLSRIASQANWTNSIGWKLLRITNTNTKKKTVAWGTLQNRALLGNLATFAMKLVTMMTLKGWHAHLGYVNLKDSTCPQSQAYHLWIIANGWPSHMAPTCAPLVRPQWESRKFFNPMLRP